MLLLTSLSLLIPVRGLAIQTTNVLGTVYRADGSLAQGTMLVNWPGFTAADGSAVAAGNTTVTIAPDGSVNMALAPNAGANPQGTYYTVVYHMNDGTVQTEYWVVPQAATATISAIRATVVPAAVAQQSVTQQYVDTSIAALQGSFLQLTGGTMAGALNLSTDPTSALQAAPKQYVDAAVAAVPRPTLPNIVANYSSTQTIPTSATYISTTFGEGSSGATIIGTKPNTDVPNSAWAAVGTVSATFNGSGATFGPAFNAGTGQIALDTGGTDETITLAISLASPYKWQICIRCNSTYTKGVTLDINGAAVDITDNTTGQTVLATGTLTSWSGTITITLSGRSVTANAFGVVLSGLFHRVVRR